MRLPWISRAHHEDVVRVQQDLVTFLKEQVKAMEERLAQPLTANVTVKLPDDFAVLQPAIMRRRGQARPQDAPTATAPLEQVRWEEVNEDDPEQMAKLAAQELGAPVSAYILARTVDRIRRHVRAAKVAKLRRTLTSGSVRSIESAAPEEPELEPAGYVPQHIKEMLERAENEPDGRI